MAEGKDQGEYAGFATEKASIRRSESIQKQTEHREQLLRKGLDTEVVDDPDYTPDFYRVRGLIQAGLWPEPQRASHLLEEKRRIYDWPLASHMVALGFGAGEKARLLVLRPYRDEQGRLNVKGKVISDSSEHHKVATKTQAEDLQWGADLQRTGIPWENGAKHFNQSIEHLLVNHSTIHGVSQTEVEGVKVLVKALTERQLLVYVRPTIRSGESTRLDIPEDPFVFVNKSGRLAREESLHSLKAKAKSVILGRKQNSLV